MIRTDEEIFFSKSFNEQMSWIGQKVLQSYIVEFEEHPLYALVKGFDKGHREDKKVEIIGIYDSIAKLEDAYICALDKLERKHENMKQVLGNMEFQRINHEKIMINVFDESYKIPLNKFLGEMKEWAKIKEGHYFYAEDNIELVDIDEI